MGTLTATYDGNNHQAKAGATWMLDNKVIGISGACELIGDSGVYSILESFGLGKGTTGINHGHVITVSINID